MVVNIGLMIIDNNFLMVLRTVSHSIEAGLSRVALILVINPCAASAMPSL